MSKDAIEKTINESQYNLCRHFVAYSGIQLPLKLVNQLEETDMGHRNTFIRGFYDNQDRLIVCQKVVYGEIEFEHRYEYDEHGVLQRAIISEADGEPRIVRVGPDGKLVQE